MCECWLLGQYADDNAYIFYFWLSWQTQTECTFLHIVFTSIRFLSVFFLFCLEKANNDIAKCVCRSTIHLFSILLFHQFAIYDKCKRIWHTHIIYIRSGISYRGYSRVQRIRIRRIFFFRLPIGAISPVDSMCLVLIQCRYFNEIWAQLRARSPLQKVLIYAYT